MLNKCTLSWETKESGRNSTKLRIRCVLVSILTRCNFIKILKFSQMPRQCAIGWENLIIAQPFTGSETAKNC